MSGTTGKEKKGQAQGTHALTMVQGDSGDCNNETQGGVYELAGRVGATEAELAGRVGTTEAYTSMCVEIYTQV